MASDKSTLVRAAADAPLAPYNAKRDFTATKEPEGRVVRRKPKAVLRFVVQKHWASHLHYDFRLEFDGVMGSWAVPKGPSLDPAVRQLAIHVEDQPVSYNGFEGQIPKGHYGAGTVIVWDSSSWTPVGDPREGLAKGKLVCQLHGQKKQDQWLLLGRCGDAWARSSAAYDVITAVPDSVVAHPLGPAEVREPRVRPIALARCSSTTCATARARRPWLPSPPAPCRAWACP